MTTEQNVDTNPDVLIIGKKKRSQIMENGLSRKELRDIDSCLQSAQWASYNWIFKRPRLFHTVVAQYNKKAPGFEEWLRMSGYLLNRHTPGIKLIRSNRVFKDETGRYYCYTTTLYFLFLLVNHYEQTWQNKYKNQEQIDA